MGLGFVYPLLFMLVSGLITLCNDEVEVDRLKKSGVLTTSDFVSKPVAITVIAAVSGLGSSYIAPKIIFADYLLIPEPLWQHHLLQ